MAIEKRETFIVVCDGCGMKTPSYHSERSAITHVEQSGWLMRKVHYVGLYGFLCPACVGKPRPDWWPKDGEVP